MANKYVVAVVPTGKVIAANQDADKVNRGKTLKSLTVPLSPTGKFPETHRWFCWWMSDEEEKQIRKDFDPADPTNPTDKHQSKIYILDDKIWTRYLILADNHLKTMEMDITSIQRSK